LLTVEGFHIPVIPLLEVVDNVGAVAFTQIGEIETKLGTMVVTLMFNVVGVAQIPAVGVKV
jgi:hypothetical protein